MSRQNRFMRDSSRSSTMSLSASRIRAAISPVPRPLNVRQKKQVKSLIRNVQELKYHVTNASAVALSSSPALRDISAVAQGDTDQTRDGDRLQLCGKIDFHFSLLIADTTNIIRITWFQWKPGTTPAASDIYLNGPSGAIDVYSTYSHDNRQMYRILSDKMYNMVGNAATAQTCNTTTTQIVRKQRINLKKVRKMVQYGGGGTDGTNKIYFFVFSDSALVTHPLITYSTKLFFRDS